MKKKKKKKVGEGKVFVVRSELRCQRRLDFVVVVVFYFVKKLSI